jgi:hypothetical protein
MATAPRGATTTSGKSFRFFSGYSRDPVMSAKLILRSCVALSVVGFVLAAVLALQYRTENGARLDDALTEVGKASGRTRDQIGDVLVHIAQELNRTAGSLLRDGIPSEQTLHDVTRNLVYSDPGFLEAGVAFAPFAYHPRIRLYGPAYVVEKDGVRFKDLDALQDYTKPDADWYHGPMEGESVWLAPRFDAARGQTLVTYGVPLRDPAGAEKPIGVLFATYTLAVFQRLLDSLDLGINGYSFVLSTNGRFLLHPNRDFGEQHIAFESFLERVSNNRDVGSIEQAFHDPTKSAAFVDPDTGLRSRVFFQQVHETDWTLGIVLADRDVLMPAREARRKFINIALIISVSIVLLVAGLARIDRDPVRGLWIVTSVFAGSCVAVGIFVVVLSMHQRLPDGENVTRISNWNTLNRFTFEQRRRTLSQREEVPLFIPTGIYIQSAYFEDASSIGISGYVWQRYTKGVHDGVGRGFIIPEAKKSTVTRAYSIEDGGTELVRWNFNAIIHQNFDHSRYPFDSERVVVDLWHNDFTRNVILIPDLASYKLMSPSARPGLIEEIQLSGWDISESSFNYLNENYKTTFGLRNFAGLTNFPNLYFGIDIQKQITGPFVANMLPLLVVSILLFAILFLGTREERHKGRLGFALDVIAACAGFFLVAILLHIALRRNLAARDIFYLEYFYFVTYAMILYVTVNYVLVTKTTIGIVHYRDNFIVKVAFWPASQLALLVFTLMAFY